jgi:integrase
MPAQLFQDKWIKNCPIPRKNDKPNQLNYFEKQELGLSLVLSVSYGGSKTWRALTYGLKGRAEYKTLGKYPRLSLAEARKLAVAYFYDPEAMNAKAAVGTFKDVAENWVRRHVDERKLRSAPKIKRMLSKYVYPEWGNEPFLTIKRRHVSILLDKIADNHGPTQADQVLIVLRGVMEWYQARDSDYVSPIVKKMQRDERDAVQRARKRVLSEEEIRTVWQIADGPFGAILKLCLLTTQRSRKVGAMKWSDLDLANGIWTIATEPREKSNAGVLRLPRLALDILKSQYRIAGNPYVFAGRDAKPFADWDWRKRKLDEELPPMDHWVIHDLRRTARSLLSKVGVSSEIAERVLGHTIKGVEGVYNRHAYTEEKAEALNKLAALVERIINPRASNVISIRA